MINAQEKAIMKNTFPDYDPRHHDAFVIAYINWAHDHNLWEYHKNRNLANPKPEPKATDYQPRR